jgi:hypothetical protein
MNDGAIPEHFRKQEIPDRVTLVIGCGDLPKIRVKTDCSTAEKFICSMRMLPGFRKMANRRSCS